VTPAEAEALAERTVAAIDADTRYETLADRERVASDLAGLRRHQPEAPDGYACASCRTSGLWPCPDAHAFSDGLLRTAALYGVEV
jgi:hypothetical protein